MFHVVSNNFSKGSRTVVMEWNGIDSAIKWAYRTDKYNAGHQINVTTGNWQAGRAKCKNQKLLLSSGLKPVSERVPSLKSGALSLSSAARHIDFHLLRCTHLFE